MEAVLLGTHMQLAEALSYLLLQRKGDLILVWPASPVIRGVLGSQAEKRNLARCRFSHLTFKRLEKDFSLVLQKLQS